MKISNDTIDELFEVIEKEYTNAELQKLLLRFSIKGWENETTSPKIIARSIPFVQSDMNNTDDIQKFVDLILNKLKERQNSIDTNQLNVKHPKLYNSLLRDGYKVENYTLFKISPEVIEDKQVPDELMVNLNSFNLATAIGHLNEAKENYKNGNWSSANAMVRSFFESVLIFINNSLNQTNKVKSGGDAIRKLSQSGFLKEDLNEIDKDSQPYGFIGGLWKMLHTKGSHPGLSIEEDSTFRYHIVIVTANYYLKRLKDNQVAVDSRNFLDY